jgi:hypothetical protein
VAEVRAWPLLVGGPGHRQPAPTEWVCGNMVTDDLQYPALREQGEMPTTYGEQKFEVVPGEVAVRFLVHDPPAEDDPHPLAELLEAAWLGYDRLADPMSLDPYGPIE